MIDRPFITSFEGHSPRIADDAFVDISARLIGKVEIGEKASIWPGAILRADEAGIVIGAGSAVLDLALLESPAGKPVIVAEKALISHQVCLHGARVETGALIGIGAIVLDKAVIGAGALVGAGAVVPPGMEVPPGPLVLGQPAKVIRELKEAERENIKEQLRELEEKAGRYLRG
jgi:carbonic anhydrase/acetyltransferase-like protein (isoleucine patch superfamily)